MCVSVDRGPMTRRAQGHMDVDDLETWLDESYVRSYRTACLILGNRHDAEEAVQEAFLRAWRFRASLAAGSDVRPWLYRVVVNTCNSKLRQEIPRRDRQSAGHDLSGVSSIEDTPTQNRGITGPAVRPAGSAPTPADRRRTALLRRSE